MQYMLSTSRLRLPRLYEDVTIAAGKVQNLAYAWQLRLNVGGIFIVPPRPAMIRNLVFCINCSLILATYSVALYDKQGRLKILLFRITTWEDYYNNFIINSYYPVGSLRHSWPHFRYR